MSPDTRSSTPVPPTICSTNKRGRRESARPKPLHELRRARDWTVGEAAEEAGLTPGRLSELERGTRWPKASELEKLATLYGVPLRVAFAVVVDEEGET